ncbi:MAG TPA: plastocyanin/azurin family copper-binding protein [Actinomycetota bacterium]
MNRTILALTVALASLAPIAGTASETTNEDPLPRVPPGFAVGVYATVGGTPTSLTFGPDTRTGFGGKRLYVADAQFGNVVVIDQASAVGDWRLVGSQPQTYASGFTQPLGVVAAPDGTLFVADNEGARPGPFGTRVYGRVWRVKDTNGDGTGDLKEVVLKDLPNGRHNTNGMAFGPDGMLYVANGNSTDDGIAGGSAEVEPWSGSVVRVDPSATNVSVADFVEEDALIAEGMRNLFDLTFSPFDPTKLYIPTNGPDNPEGDDNLYLTDMDDLRQKRDPVTGELLFDEDGNPIMEPVIDDFGFPSCLYKGSLEPFQNPGAAVISRFGPCPVSTVPRPIGSFGLHVSADGLAFQTTDRWGDDFKNDLFVAEFGNFFGNRVVGHRVVRVELSGDGTTVERTSDFLSGAAPLDVTFSSLGSAMYVADFEGAIYWVVKAADVPRVIDVQIQNLQFLPQALVIPEGTTIRWTNTEGPALPMNHNVTGRQALRSDGSQDPGAEINSGPLLPGDSHSYRFDTPGTWLYTCTINPIHNAAMHGSITVVPAGS